MRSLISRRASLATLSMLLLLAAAGAAHAGLVSFGCFPVNNLQVVPPALFESNGWGRCTFDTATNVFEWDIQYSAIGGPVTSAHFHTGAAGVNGPIALTVATDSATGSAILTPTQAADLQAGHWYFDAHGLGVPNGLVRGQVVDTGCALKVYHCFPFSGAQVVPPSGSAATGSGTFVLNTSTGEFQCEFSWSGLSGPPTAVQIHVGAAGTTGVLFNGVALNNPNTSGFTLSPNEQAEILAGNWFYDVHTAQYPNGEIRGQVVDGDCPQWLDMGGALAGTFGEPSIIGYGTMTGGSVDDVRLFDAKPSIPSFLVIGGHPVELPFKGGVMVPIPQLILHYFKIGDTGGAPFGFTWPPDAVLVGFHLYWQHWLPDPAGSEGFAASNGLQSIGQ